MRPATTIRSSARASRSRCATHASCATSILDGARHGGGVRALRRGAFRTHGAPAIHRRRPRGRAGRGRRQPLRPAHDVRREDGGDGSRARSAHARPRSPDPRPFPTSCSTPESSSACALPERTSRPKWVPRRGSNSAPGSRARRLRLRPSASTAARRRTARAPRRCAASSRSRAGARGPRAGRG